MKLALDWIDPSGNTPTRLSDLEVVFQNIVGVVLGFAGIAFFVLLLLGGFKYMSAGSDPKTMESAKKSLTSAFAGLLIVLLAYVIIAFIEKFTGVDLKEFRIKP